MRPDGRAQIGVGVVGLDRQEVLDRTRLPNSRCSAGKNQPAFGVYDQRPVVGDELGKQADEEQDAENPQRPQPASVRAKDRDAAAGQRRHQRASKSMRGINNGEHDVAHHLQHQTEQREHVQRRKDHRIIAPDRRVEAEQPEPVEREHDLDQQTPS